MLLISTPVRPRHPMRQRLGSVSHIDVILWWSIFGTCHSAVCHHHHPRCIFASCHSSWWTILAKKNCRKLILGHMTAGFAHGRQRRHWRYATIVIGGCHVLVEFGHCAVGILCRLYVGITIDSLIFHKVHLFDLHLKKIGKQELM